MGELSPEALACYRDGDGLSFTDVLTRDNLDSTRLDEVLCDPVNFHSIVELHIEQGKVLEKQGLPVGIVNGIAGPAWIQFDWLGEAGHAGATPMPGRLDALAGAAEWLQILERLPAKLSDTAVATVGKLEVFPGGPNIIPGQVRLVADIRDISLASRDAVVESAIKAAKTIAARRNLQLKVEAKVQVAPTAMSKPIIDAIHKSIESVGIDPFYLPSGAGHDTMVLGRYIPAGMIFVRCRDGISHSPKEWVDLADISIGCAVLKETLEQLAV
jgi:allantoate deiminase